jgi:hypothetical protein
MALANNALLQLTQRIRRNTQGAKQLVPRAVGHGLLHAVYTALHSKTVVLAVCLSVSSAHL